MKLEKIIGSTNVAKDLPEELRDEIGQKVVQNFEKDQDSRKQWIDRNEEGMKLALQVVEEKNFPWPSAPLSKDTEVLTQRGWISVKDIQDGETILTRNDSSEELSWQVAEGTVEVFSEKMYWYKSKSVDQLVTPEHQMVVLNSMRKPVRISAEQLWSKTGYRIPLTGIWSSGDSILTEDECELLGWYAAEGWQNITHTGPGSIFIGQSQSANPEKCEHLRQLFIRLGIQYKWINDAQCQLEARTVSERLKVEIRNQYGKTCYTKAVPINVLTSTKKNIQAFLRGYIFGDGHSRLRENRNHVVNTASTVSKQLADDLQILSQLAGIRCTIHILPASSGGTIKGRQIHGAATTYILSFNQKKYAKVDAAKYQVVNYNDYAYCVTVPNHAIYIRRNGIASWTGNSNVKFPLVTLASIQFASRVDLFNDPDIVKMKVTGFDPTGEKTDRALRLTKHMSYQLSEEMPEWGEGNDKLFHALPIVGTMFKKSFFDPIKGRNVSTLVYPTDLVFDYWAEDVENCNRKTEILLETPNRIYEKTKAGLYLDVDLSTDTPSPERPLASEQEGLEAYEDDDAPLTNLECHCYWDLDEDGYKEPYIITVNKQSAKVLRIVPRFDKEGIQKNSDGEVISITAIEHYTQFDFMPNPEGGALGIGFSHLLGPINASVNTLINQLIDSGTLNNLQSGFIGKGIKVKSGKLEIQPGEWKFVQSTGEDLNKNIVPLPTKDPSDVLFKLLELLVQAGERVGSVTDALTGDNPPTNQPATTTMAMVDQGLKVFKKVHKRLYAAFTKEFKKLFNLNKLYLQPVAYFTTLGITPSQEKQMLGVTQDVQKMSGQMVVSQDDYKESDFQVTPSADPNVMTTMERAKKIEALIQTQQIFNWPMEVVKRRYVELMQFPNAEELLQPVPPPPNPEMIKLQLEAKKLEMDAGKSQMEMQMKQMELEGKKADAGMKQADMQMKQAELEVEMQRLDAEKEKMQMEILKIEAEIRKILAEIEQGEAKIQLEGSKMQMEGQKMQHEAMMQDKEHNMQREQMQNDSMMREKEMDTNSKLKEKEIGVREKAATMKSASQKGTKNAKTS